MLHCRGGNGSGRDRESLNMRLPLRVLSQGMFEFCPALLAVVAVRRKGVFDTVDGSFGGGGTMMSGGRESPEHDKTSNSPNKNDHSNENTTNGMSHLGGLWKEVSDAP